MVIRMSENFVLFDSRMGDKADWGDFFLKHLIDVCKGEIEAGNRCNRTDQLYEIK